MKASVGFLQSVELTGTTAIPRVLIMNLNQIFAKLAGRIHSGAWKATRLILLTIALCGPRAQADICPLDLPGEVDFQVFFNNGFPCYPNGGSYFDVNMNNIGHYQGWCADGFATINVSINPGNPCLPQGFSQFYEGNVIDSLDASCPIHNPTIPNYIYQPDPNFIPDQCVWNEINYLLNHKRGNNPDAVQAAIWDLISPLDLAAFNTLPTFAGGAMPPQAEQDRLAMVADAKAHSNFIPGPGDVRAAILDSGPLVQVVFVEIPCAVSLPHLTLRKTVETPVDFPSPGTPVYYAYFVQNDGNVTVTNVVVVDDNGTPSYSGDDEVVGFVASLAPGQSQVFSRTLIPPVSICTTNSAGTVQTGTLVTKRFPNGDIEVTFIQGTNVNDNTYGTNAIGWGATGHKLSDLTGSDQATFQFQNATGKVVLSFKLDYLSASALYPSGYGTLGVKGGDGGMIVGNASNVVSYSTSLTENLNKQPFLGQLGKYKVNSPGQNDPNRTQWEYRMIYKVVVKGTAFGSVGFGRATLSDQHNSPAKAGFKNFTPLQCDSCVTNIATAIASFGTNSPIASAQAFVCSSPLTGGCHPLTSCIPPYPYASSNPLTSMVFSESEVLRAFTVSVTNDCFPTQLRLFYNDEHALLLGVRRVIVKTKTGSTTNNYPVSPLLANPGSVIDPQVGSTILAGNQAAVDPFNRPLFPSLFITDITSDPTSLLGDWQFGGTPIPPHAVFGTWKGAVKTIDATRTPAVTTITTDADPAKNNWNLGNGGPVPAGLLNAGYGAEVRWDIARLGLVSGHTYRLYFMIHDGDQNKTGGDAGQGCATLRIPQ